MRTANECVAEVSGMKGDPTELISNENIGYVGISPREEYLKTIETYACDSFEHSAKKRKGRGDKMSEVIAVKCDTCGKNSFDYMGDGWIRTKCFTKYAKRGEKGCCAKTEIYILNYDKDTHFCSWDCLKNHGKKKEGVKK